MGLRPLRCKQEREVNISPQVINKYYHANQQAMLEYLRIEQHLNFPHMLEVLCEDRRKAHWVKNQSSDHAAMEKLFMNKEAQAWLNLICNRWMPIVHKFEVILEWVFLIYAFMTWIFVNIGEFMRR